LDPRKWKYAEVFQFTLFARIFLQIHNNITWRGRVTHMEEMRNAYKILVAKPDLNSPF
jgi:hypothetical protein